MVYDPGCLSVVTSFLQEATPFFMPITTLTTNQRVIKVYKQCLDYVLKIIFRLVTKRESETAWIRPQHLAELLYPNFLISIPIVLDILIAYGRSNGPLLQRLLTQIFAIDPRYRSDLSEAMAYLKRAFTNVQEKVDQNDALTDFDDLALYALDCAANICMLLEMLPEAIDVALEMQLEQTITAFYDTTLPLLYKHICAINSASSSLYFLNQCRMELLTSFRCLSNIYLERILSDPYVYVRLFSKYFVNTYRF